MHVGGVCRRSVEREQKIEETRDDPEPSAEYYFLVTLTIFDFATTRDNSPCVQRATCMQHNPGYDLGPAWGQPRTPSNKTPRSRRMKPGEVAFFFSSYKKNRWRVY